MEQLPLLRYVESKGYDITSEMYSIYWEIMSTFTNYQFAYQYIEGSAKEDIETAEEPGMHLIIEPIILPSVSSALFIAMYGDFEAHLNMICTGHMNNHSFKIGLKDIAGNGIERAVTYLEKIVGISIKNSKEWNQLRHWNRIRNVLVHNNGVIRDTKDESSIDFLNLGTNPKFNKVYLTINDCDKFHSLIPQFYRMCI